MFDVNKNLNRIYSTLDLNFEYTKNSFKYLCNFLIDLKNIGKFITFDDAISGDFDNKIPNFILDHHIDYYPLETLELAKWEYDNEIISNIFIFNKIYDEQSNYSQKTYSVEDLDIPFLRKCEQKGFNIGYHVNALGQAKIEDKSTRYSENLYDNIQPQLNLINRSKEIFNQDLANLRKYFNITNAIPHGGGEGNNSINFDYSSQNLKLVYNGRQVEDRIKFKWLNFSDSVGPFYNKLRAKGIVYFSSQNRLETLKIFCNQKKLFHILIHPGRFQKGMNFFKNNKINYKGFNYPKDQLKLFSEYKNTDPNNITFSKDLSKLYELFLKREKTTLVYYKLEKFDKEKNLDLAVKRPVPKMEFPDNFEKFSKSTFWFDRIFCPNGIQTYLEFSKIKNYQII